MDYDGREHYASPDIRCPSRPRLGKARRTALLPKDVLVEEAGLEQDFYRHFADTQDLVTVKDAALNEK
jgi:hypothetical protein